MVEMRAPNLEDEEAGVTAFLASLEWLYWTHRYPSAVQGMVLRLLTLSGLDPWSWKQVAGRLAAFLGPGSGAPVEQPDGEAAQVWLKQIIEDLWGYANEAGIGMGEPLVCPTYLANYGYTQEMYLADLHTIYGQPAAYPYAQPWPAAPALPQNAYAQLGFFPQAVAMMGVTAAAIERLVERGTHHGDHD